MASNIDVTLKRYNEEGEYDIILPVTHLGQIYVDNTLEEGQTLSDFLTNTYINVDQIGAANGLATLDGNQKLTLSQLPTGITGGLKFRGSLGVDTDLDTLGVLYTIAEEAQGSYWIATADIELTSTAHSVVLAPGDEGDSTFPITIEAGDWIILSSWAEDDYDFAIVNNTYQNANTTEHGIVQLSEATDTTGTSDKVITEGILGGLLVADNSDLNGTTNTNLIAPAAHHHDGRYYTETEVQGFFAGTTPITGYNYANWDTAYGDKVDAVEFNTGDGVLTLTRQDAGTLTVDLDGRYLEGLTPAQTDGADGIVIANTGRDFTVAHADTSSQASVDNADGTVIQDITLDTFGHITALGSKNLDDRYYTEDEFHTWLNGTTAIDEHFFTEILYGESPIAVNAGTIIIDTSALETP